jgi:hypothetical protein
MISRWRVVDDVSNYMFTNFLFVDKCEHNDVTNSYEYVNKGILYQVFLVQVIFNSHISL